MATCCTVFGVIVVDDGDGAGCNVAATALSMMLGMWCVEGNEGLCKVEERAVHSCCC